MAPRVGPRGTTLGDVMRVANGDTTPITDNRAGYTFRQRTPGVSVLPQGMTGESVLRQIIGGPSSGYGQKYGGYSTMEQLKAATLGQTFRLPNFIQQLAEQAAANRGVIESQMAEQAQLRPGTMAYEEGKRIKEAMGTRLSDDEAVRAALANLAGVRRQEERVAAAAPSVDKMLYERSLGYGGPNATQNLIELQRLGLVPVTTPYETRANPFGGVEPNKARLEDLALRPTPGMSVEDAQKLYERRNAAMALSPTTQLARQQAEDELRAAQYAANMERMNAITPLSPIQPGAGTTAEGQPVSLSTQELTLNRVLPQITGKYDPILQRDVVPQEELVQQLSNVPLANLAQQIAQQVYGLPAPLTEGLFTPEVDVAYANEQFKMQQAQDRAAGIDPTASVQDIILNTRGPEGLLEYQDLIAQGAIEKANEGVGNAETDAFDDAMLRQYGVTPDMAAGDFPANTARQYFADSNFVAYLNQATTEVKNAEATSLEEKRNAAKEVAAQYIDQTGDVVGGTVLLNTLLSYDYLYTYGE